MINFPHSLLEKPFRELEKKREREQRHGKYGNYLHYDLEEHQKTWEAESQDAETLTSGGTPGSLVEVSATSQGSDDGSNDPNTRSTSTTGAVGHC